MTAGAAGPAAVGATPAIVELDVGTRLYGKASGGLLVGGQPLRVLRLNAAAVLVVRGWQAGRPVHGDRQYRMARRLHDDGLLVLRSFGARAAAGRQVRTASPSTDEVTVVVPVRDRAAGLSRCLAGIGPCARVLVVDDGSRDPAATAAVAAEHGAELLVRGVNGGPAAARNDGLRAVRTPLVAFVDSDCVLPTGWLSDLLPVLLDEQTAIVGPRIVGAGTEPGSSRREPGRVGGTGRRRSGGRVRRALARYEVSHGPLDLGAAAGPVRSGGRVGHLPAAVLLCRVDALAAGFDESMRVGEDVDLVWRVAAAGRGVRYEPRVVVRHETRRTLVHWLRQRHGYGTAAATLDARHPGAVAPVVVNRWSLPALLALATSHPALAGGCTALTGMLLAGRLPAADGRARACAALTTQGFGWTLLGLADWAARVGLPVLLPLCALPRSGTGGRARRVVAVVIALRLTRTGRGRSRQLGVVSWSALRVLDDLSYGVGVWHGALRHRRPAVVLPRIS